MAALIGSIGTVINMHQAVFGNALGNPAYSSQLEVAEGPNGQAAIVATYNTNLTNVNNVALADTVLKNLFVTTANGVTQQNVDAIKLYLVSVFAIYPTAKGQIISNLTTILGTLENDGAWGGAAIAFNNAAAADFAYSNNPANVLDGNPASPTTIALTENQDTIIVSNPETISTVDGVLGASSRDSTLVGTFTFDDLIQGVGNTQVNLSFNSGFTGGDAPYVTMSGVDQINFRATAAVSAVFDASTYGSDVSVITASGNRDATISLTNLETRGDFSLSSASNFIGDISLGNTVFDNSGRESLATPNTIEDQDDSVYTTNAMSTTLYSPIGTDANLYIDGSATGGESSVRLLATEIEVNAGSGRLARGSSGDKVGAHVFNYVNTTDDLITAPVITVSTVDINVAKASFGEAVISNWANKTSDNGDAQALGVNVSTVTIDLEDEAAALFEVRNIASNSQEGDDGSINPAVFAGNITIGTITANGNTDADLGMKVLQLASISTGGVEAVTGGNVTVGAVIATGNNPDAGDISLEVLNLAELTGPNADYTTQLGNLSMSNITMTGWNEVNVDLQNTVNFGTVGAGESALGANATIGNVSAGVITLEGGGDVALNVADGNGIGRGQGAVTVGTMNLGNISVTSGGSGSVSIDRFADSVDENATIGATNIAAGGSVVISSENSSSFSVDIEASARDLGDASVGQITIGNVSVGSTQANVSISASANVLPDANEKQIVTANIAGVSIGNISAQASGDSDNDASIYMYLAGYGSFGPSPTDEDTGHSGTIGNVTIGTLTAIAEGGEASSVGDAYVSVSISSDARNADTSIGNIQIGNVNVQGQDNASLYLRAEAFFDTTNNFFGGDATIGNVTVGNVSVANLDGNTDNPDAGNYDARVQVELTADAQAINREVNATIASVTLGTITVNAGDESESDNREAMITVDINASADGGTYVGEFSGATAVVVATDSITVTDHKYLTGDAVTYDNDGGTNIGGLTDGSTYYVIVVNENTIKLASSSNNANAGTAINLTAVGVGTQTLTYAQPSTAELSDITTGAMTLTATGDSQDARVRINITSEVIENGTADVSAVDLGNITMNADGSSDIAISVDAIIGNDGDATINDVMIGNLASNAKSDSVDIFVNITADVRNDGNAEVSNVTLGTITSLASSTVDADINFNAKVNAEGNAIVSNIEVGNLDIESTDSDLTFDVTFRSLVNQTGTAEVSQITLGNIDLQAYDTSDISIDVQATVGTGDALISAIAIGDIKNTSTTDSADVTIDITAEVRNGAGTTSISDVLIGNITVVSLSEFYQNDIEIDINANQYGTTELSTLDNDASIDVITIGALSVTALGEDAAGDVDIEIQARVLDAGAKLIAGDASVTNVEIGAITVTTGSRVEVSIDISANVTSDTGDKANIGDALISNVKFGNVVAAGGDASFSEIDISFDANGDNATVDQIEIGDVLLTSAAGAVSNVDVSLSADADNGDATVSNIMIGNVGNANTSTFFSSDAGVNVDIIARVLENSGNALISNVEVGNVSASGEDEVFAEVNVVAAGGEDNLEPVSSVIEDITVGDITSSARNTESFSIASLLVEASALATSDSTAIEASISGIEVGNLSSTGQGVVASVFGLNAELSTSSNTTFKAAVENVDVGDITANGLGSGGSLLFAGGVIEASAFSTVPGDRTTRSEAVIKDVTVGNIELNSLGDGEDLLQLTFIASASGERFGDIDNLNVGNLTLTAGDNSIVNTNVAVLANVNEVGANDGDIEGVTIGDITVSVGSFGEDGVEFPGPFPVGLGVDQGINILAADDILDVEIGNFTVSIVGDGSILDEQDIFIDAGNVDSYVSTVTLGDVDFSATGDNNVIAGSLFVTADNTIESVSVGNVSLGANGVDTSVGFIVDVGTLKGVDNVDEVAIGAVNLDATSNEGTNANATFNLNVFGEDEIGSITIGAPAAVGEEDVGFDLRAVGVNSNAEAIVLVTSDVNVLGSLDIGSISIEASGNLATAGVSVDVSVEDSLGQVTIGNVLIAAISDVPQVDNEETDNSAYAELVVNLNVTTTATGVDEGVFTGLSFGNIDISAVGSASKALVNVDVGIAGSSSGDIEIGDLNISLSNTADASTTAFVTVDVKHSGEGDIVIGDITVSSLVPADYSNDVDGVGRLNSAQVAAELVLDSSGDIDLGDITVVGGIYAKSGVDGVSGSNSVGVFNNDITAQSSLVDIDEGAGTDFVLKGGQQLEFDEDLRYTFVYDQVESVWNLDGVTFAAFGIDPKQFDISETSANTFEVLGNLDSANSYTDGAVDVIATVTFDGESITIDWNSEYFSDANGVIDITFAGVHGLINDLDAVTLSLEAGAVNNVTLDPVDLVVLDNFYEFSSNGSWTDFTADGTITIGEVDYSDYADLVSDDGIVGTIDVLIDVSDMQSFGYNGTTNLSGITINGAQGETEIIGTVGNDTISGQAKADVIDGGAGDDLMRGNAGADQLTGGAGADTFVYTSGSTGVTIAGADTITDFTTAADTIKTSISGLVAEDVLIADGTSLADFAAFVTAANSAFNAGGDDVYVAWNATGSGNAWVAINNNGGVNFTFGDSLIVLTGINSGAEIAAANFIA